MYLKSIEVQGFKSFANKLKFEFPEGITGIVGPNGSGKSNVADAVRWVLGEQSAKQLRSGNMQDVIFAGTETRKAQSFASVAITFDNSDHMLDVDYEEVTVTRRLYRSGESEYLLNQSNVRLKDINEIFYDTGIGQEGYSIIGQGQIDRILSGKAEERRELFDEAAGIVKFKKRKKMTLKRLEEEHQNLLRVSDILKELTSRIGPLKKQSETARIYLDLRDSLRELEIMNFVMEEERTGQMMKEVSDRIDIVENEMAETRVQFDRTKTEYDRLEQQMEELSARISELNDKNSNIAVIRQQLIGQTELLKEQIRAAEEAKSRYTERSAQIRTEIKELEDELEALLAQEAGSAQAEQEILEKERQLSEQLKTLDASISETVAGIESKKNEVISMLESRASVKGKIQRYGTMLEQLSIRRSEISGRLLVLREDEDRYRKESSAHEEELKTLQ
ncbi:MAG: AAA family ATPase, partial [Lachnospiraceae bacterium]|nr:AAA family ATPase [Lachnospiraceae bacterium]